MCRDAPSFEQFAWTLGNHSLEIWRIQKRKTGGKVAAGVAEAVVQKLRISTEKQRKT